MGFKLLRDTIASYKGLSEAEKPQGSDAVIQTWIRQQSKVARLNLAPYYKAWGWPGHGLGTTWAQPENGLRESEADK